MIRTFKPVIFFIAIVFFATPLFTNASTITLSPSSVVVREGESFNIDVTINAPGTQEYTVKMDTVFTPEVVRINTWNFGSQWTVLRQPGYDSFNNTTGSLTRTGGYPSGFTGSVKFGTANFIAGKPGKGTISVTGNSFVFNAASQNTYTGGNVVNIEVLPAVKKEPAPKPDPIVTPKPEPDLIDYTFDIALVLDKPVFSSGEKVTSLVHLTNLSSEVSSLDVPINYSIFDANGNLVFTDSTLVDLSSTNKQFKYQANVSKLPPGIYSIVSSVALENMTSPAESKGHFRIESEVVVEVITDQYLNNTLLYIIAALLLGLLIGGLIARRRNGKEEKEVEGEDVESDVIREVASVEEEDKIEKPARKTKKKTTKKGSKTSKAKSK